MSADLGNAADVKVEVYETADGDRLLILRCMKCSQELGEVVAETIIDLRHRCEVKAK
jgi:hypothetical protein